MKRAQWAAAAAALAGTAGSTCAGVAFDAPEVHIVGLVSSSVRAADLDGDGWLDLASANRESHDVAVLRNSGKGLFLPPVSWPVAPRGGEPTPRTLVIADCDSDGRPDFVTANEGDHTISVLRNQGGMAFAAPLQFPVAERPTGMTAGDFDGDGRPDLAVTHRGTGTGPLVVLRNVDGPFGDWAGFAPAGSYAVGADSREVIGADLDGDGILDLVAVNRTSATLSLLLGIGDGTFQPIPAVPAGVQPRDVVAADLSGSGRLDLAVADFGSNTAWVLRNDGVDAFGRPVFAAPVGYPGHGSAPHSLTAADIDGDGASDLIMANVQNGGSVTVLMNWGDGTFVGSYLLPIGEGTSSSASVIAADVTGNGRPDIVTANARDVGSISLIRNRSTVTEPAGPDLDGSGSVDFADLLILIGNWGACLPSGGCTGDLNHDLVVDFADLVILLSFWG